MKLRRERNKSVKQSKLDKTSKSTTTVGAGA